MTGVPRTLIGREDRRRRIGSDFIRMTTPSETTLDSGTALCGRVGVMVVSPTPGTTGGPAKVIAGANGCMDLSRTQVLPTLAAATFRIGLIMERGFSAAEDQPWL
jgi:hypothetical protein